VSILSANEISKSFGGLTAVDNLSFELQKDEVLALIGPNGAGKTTVFNCLSGFLPPDAGAVYLDEQPLGGLQPFQICQLGMARTFQIVKPFLTISVLDNVMIGALAREKSSGRAHKAALEIIDFMGLSNWTHQEAQGLPLPLRKRLELARALATQPKILLLDEVMAGLNPTEVDELINLLKAVNRQGVSILLIEHVMRGVMALSQRVIVISYGVKIAEGKPEEIVENKEVIEAYLGKEFLSARSQ
jgi:branched-chain amino acid transport system ATP-binding protein